jgi:hypothetical protein
VAVAAGVDVDAGVDVAIDTGAAQAVTSKASTNIKYFIRGSPIVDITGQA